MRKLSDGQVLLYSGVVGVIVFIIVNMNRCTSGFDEALYMVFPMSFLGVIVFINKYLLKNK